MTNQQALISELSQKYEISKELDEKMQVVSKEISELERFEVHLQEIDRSTQKHMLAPLGKGVYIPTDISDKKLFVDVGSGIFIRKSPHEARIIIEEQLKKLQDMRLLIGHTIQETNKELQDLVAQIEKQR